MIDSTADYAYFLGIFIASFGGSMFGVGSKEEKIKVPGGLPNEVMNIIWFLMGGALFAAHVLFLIVYEAPSGKGTYAWYFSLALVNLFLQHSGCRLFDLGMKTWMYWASAVCAIVNLATVVGLVTVAAIEHRFLVWIFLIPYGLWLVYVAYVDIMSALKNRKASVGSKRR